MGVSSMGQWAVKYGLGNDFAKWMTEAGTHWGY